MSKTRGKNISFYHFRLQEIDPTEPDKYLDYQYYIDGLILNNF